MSTYESRIHEIDGLRGIAILSVVIFHLVVFPGIAQKYRREKEKWSRLW